LNLFFDGSQGNEIYNYLRARSESTGEIHNYAKAITKSWTPQNTKTDIPRLGNSDNYGKVSDRWLEDGSFFRLKTLEFGYSLPKTLLRNINLDNLRIYTAMENLFMITKYKGYSPDLGQNDDQNGGGTGVFTRGIDYGRYPQSRSISFGLQVNF